MTNIICNYYERNGSMNKPYTVDVIIPAYRPDEKLTKLVAMLQQQTYPIDHILIINTEESYWNPSLIEDMDRVEVFHIKKSEFDHGATRRLGESFSNADILVYMTQDAVPANTALLYHLLKAFQNPDVKAAYARQLPDKDCRIVESYTREFNYPAQSRIKSSADLEELGIKTYFCSNVCAAYDHKTYKELGGFPKKAIFNEDMIYAGHLVQAGYSIAYVAEAEVVHSHNYSFMQQFHRNFDLAVSQADHPEVFSGIKSEKEGIKLVQKTASYLCEQKQKKWIPKMIVDSGFKFLGYRFGKMYRRLPKKIVRAFSMNKGYWK